MQQFRQGELSHIHVNVRQIGDTKGLHHLVCGVGVDTRQQCPDVFGTGRLAFDLISQLFFFFDDSIPI